MFDALKRLLSIDKKAKPAVQKVSNLQQLLNIKNSVPEDGGRLRMQSGDNQLNRLSNEPSVGSLFNGLTFGNGIVGYNPTPPAAMPSLNREQEKVLYKDGSYDYFDLQNDPGIFAQPLRPRNPPLKRYRTESI